MTRDNQPTLITVMALALAVVAFLGVAFWQVYWLDEVVWWGLLAPAASLLLTGFALAAVLWPAAEPLGVKRFLRGAAFLLLVFCVAPLFSPAPVATVLFIPAAVTLWLAADNA